MDMVERVARAICRSKGLNPDCLYQHNFAEDYPEDERREYDDPFTGEPRVQLFHRSWRHSVPAARAAIEAMREPTDHMTFVGQSRRYDSVWSIGAVWRAMLDAALTPPVRSQEGS